MAEWTIDKKDVVSTVDGNYILYKNRPLVREENILCYGSMSERYYLRMTILSEKEFRGTKVPDQIYIELVCTDPKVSAKERIPEKAIKSGMFEAFDFGIAWLERYLRK